MSKAPKFRAGTHPLVVAHALEFAAQKKQLEKAASYLFHEIRAALKSFPAGQRRDDAVAAANKTYTYQTADLNLMRGSN